MSQEAIDKAMGQIKDICREAKIGDVFEGKVVRIESYGAFVNLFGKTDGLLHVSNISWNHVAKVEDVLKLGDLIDVKVIEIENGKVNVSAKALLPKPANYKEPERNRGPRKDNRRSNGPRRFDHHKNDEAKENKAEEAAPKAQEQPKEAE